MTQKKKKLLILVDGSSYLHRAFHALPPLTTSKGEPTGAIYGVVNMLRKILSEYKPDYVAVVLDAKGKNFRHEIYPQYKATRSPMEDSLKIQIKPLHDIIQAMGVPLLIIEGVEADDVIGTLARLATEQGITTLISTGDKDIAQLVRPTVTLINTMTNTTMNVQGVKERFGVVPEQMIDYLTLVGDTSDNILGVSGVGPKTAIKWLEEYGSLVNIIKHKDTINGKVGENLRASLDRLPLVKKLVTIKDDLKLDIDIEDLVCKKIDAEKLTTLFTHLEFRSWLVDLTGNQKSSYQVVSKHHLILTKEDFTLWLKKLEQAKSFAFDTETTSLDIIQAEIIGISFAIKTGEAIYIPLGHVYDGAPSQLERDYVLQNLKPIFADFSKIKLGQNIKYDVNILANYGIEVQGIGYDTMIESYILNSSSNQHDKESLALRYLGKTITTYEDLVGKGAKQIPFNQLKLEIAAPYAAFDADLVIQLHEVLWPQIEKVREQAKVFKGIEMPLIEVLSRMERRGVCIDEKFLNKLSEEFKTRLQSLEHRIYKDATAEFNINSPLQLQEILYERLKLPILQKTPTGQPSTAESVLQDLAFSYTLPKLILEYRSLSKLKSTYADALPKRINSKTGRIHTFYNQAITTTGRLSSTDPNLQNIPIRTDEGRKIRRAFIAPQGYKIISADYSQIELRVMAHLSQDRNLLKAFQEGDDIHSMVASEIFGIRLEEVTDDMRRDAKTINFGLIYGMSAFGLAKRIGMSREDAQKYINLYFARYPGMKEYIEKMKEFAHTHGFVESIFGRRLYIPDIKAKKFARKLAAERVAINAPIQGSAADIIKIAMININQWLQNCNFKIAMIMQVHDELVFEVASEYVAIAQKEIRDRMEKAVKISMPIVVGMGIGNNWDEAH
ncbi:MAG: DNA polymerase I [Coxiellaceae bacterium]|jgi:DNA polymerase-1|nr:DNA polymerase I [Coxiellaceae bacterium]